MIEDSDDDEGFTEDWAHGTQWEREEVIDDAINSIPPDETGAPGLFDDEFDALFAPERDGTKRRRLETSERRSLGQKLEQDGPVPLSPEPQQRPTDLFDTPAPQPTPGAMPRDTNIQGTPAARSQFMGSEILTPATTKTPFRSKPRFVLSTKKPPDTQPIFRGDKPLISQPGSPPERRKPAFILPRSPSPSAAADDIPAPFSPSSRALRRRGRPRVDAENYAPGGMAAEARSWILEMGSKRETVSALALQPNQAHGVSRYLVAARVIHANQAVLSSSGPLTFIQAEAMGGSLPERERQGLIYIMAMGLPRSKPASREITSPPSTVQTATIQPGNLLGIHHGLAWDVELRESQPLSSAMKSVEMHQPTPSRTDVGRAPKKDWLVAMEWDIIET